MKIALIGYGKMGKAIEEVAVSGGHEIVLKVGIENLEDNTPENIRKADVAIEFTGPESAFDNIIRCLEAGVPVVSGSTGWLSRLEEVRQFVRNNGHTFLYASNFSVGGQHFFRTEPATGGGDGFSPRIRGSTDRSSPYGKERRAQRDGDHAGRADHGKNSPQKSMGQSY
jgi:hypothetical protein